VGVRAFIEHWTFGADGAAAAAAAEAAHFRQTGVAVEWRVFSHDGPANLEAALAAAGFAPEPAESFMVFDLAGRPDFGPLPAGVTVRRVGDTAGLEDVLAVRAAAFGGEHAALEQELAARLADPTLALYVAYVDGTPAASARLEAPLDRPFAGLYGGGVRPQWRGRGLYRALVAARAEEAAGRGVRYLTVDAAETSRPILQRIGFQALATVRGWELRP
jgi:GNAT superfamily N-acetyltransferase